jgi:hypothetical protein
VERGEELRQTILELLMPSGDSVGESGHRRCDIRQVQGSLKDAREFFDRLRELGEPMHIRSYPGEIITLGGETRVGFRRHSKSGEPTIDVWVQYIPGVRKIKFVQSVNNDRAR